MKLTNKIGSGAQAEVFELEGCTYKVFRQGYGKAGVYYEAALVSAVEEIGLPTAKIHQVFESEGQMVIEMDYIRGKTLSDIFYSGQMSVQEYLETLISLQSRVHSTTLILPAKTKINLENRIVTGKLAESTKRRLLHALEQLPVETSLCHGDFHGHNILCRDKEYFFIDWIDASNGCKHADVCRTYMLYSFHSPDLAEKYLDMYCSIESTDKQHVLQWLPVVAAARLNDNNCHEFEKIFSWIGSLNEL